MINMLPLSLLEDLRVQVGPELEVLTEKDGTYFQELSQGWTNIGRQTPCAIVLPATEEQIQQTVRYSNVSILLAPLLIPLVRYNGRFEHLCRLSLRVAAIASGQALANRVSSST